MSAGPTAPAPRTWLLLGDKLGDNAQVQRVVDALGWPAEMKRLVFRPRYRLGKPRFAVSLRHLDRRASSGLEPPWPELIITIGRRPAMAALWVREQAGSATRVVLLGRPKRWLERFDLVVVPPQYEIPERANVLRIRLPLMDVDPSRLREGEAQWREELKALPRPLTAVLIGGATQPYRFDVHGARELVAAVTRARDVGSLYFSTSRRTPPAVVDALQECLPANAQLFRWSPEAQRNPYHGLLALADRFIVTADSVSMMVEVARLGRPLVIYPLPWRSPRWTGLQRRLQKLAWSSGVGASIASGLVDMGLLGYPRELERLHRALFAAGLAAPFGAPFARPAAPACNEAEHVAQRISAIMGRERGRRAPA